MNCLGPEGDPSMEMWVTLARLNMIFICYGGEAGALVNSSDDART